MRKSSPRKWILRSVSQVRESDASRVHAENHRPFRKDLCDETDCTTPIARVAATKLRDMVFPQRLYYNQTIFRSSTENRGGNNEIAQCGVELIGATGLRADIEMIAMAIDALRICGLDDFHIELGHVDFFRSLAAQMAMEPEEEERMRRLIESKNFAALNLLLEPYKGQLASQVLRSLSKLFGDRKILDEAERLSAQMRRWII